MAVRSIAGSGIADAGEAEWIGRWIARLITQDTTKKTPNLKLGGGLESGDGADDEIGIEEQEGQVPAKGGKTRCGRQHEARSLL